MNPNLNISASERKKASVTTNKTTRTVNFDVGLKITQSLEDLGLEFTLKAPEDLSVQNELSSMSVEERGRAAVTMLTTGMYLSPNSENGGGSFDATSALNSFLNSQISNIAGKALSTIDIGFGIDNSTSLTGATQTDYNFSFAKRFWGNRISVIIGGKVSSGNDAQNTGMSIINNVRCDKILVEFLRVNTWIKKWFDIDYSEYTLKQSGYQHMPLDLKIKYLEMVKNFKEVTVCEDVSEHYLYWEDHVNHNPLDCCNLRLPAEYYERKRAEHEAVRQQMEEENKPRYIQGNLFQE
jgi:hypothetical protein